MKKVGYYIFLVTFLIIFIPVVILGGVGPGIKVPGIINKLPITPAVTAVPEKTQENIKIKVFVSKENKVMEMDFEEYIKGVLSAEMPASFDIEALKAQAVAARTFAAAAMRTYGGGGCAKHKDADMCSDVHCQAWVSKEDRFKSWDKNKAEEYWKKISDAVEATCGMIIVYQNQIAKHVKYCSTSGGQTEDSINVFGYSEPYLVSVQSPNEEESPVFKSSQILTKTEFIKRMRELSPDIKLAASTLGSQIKILALTEGKRVKSIKIGDKTFTGVDIRWAMGLKSADFTVKVEKNNVVFNVKGNGHGVGMSQWGANEMGKRGSKYDEIVKHYYKGVEIKKINEVLTIKN